MLLINCKFGFSERSIIQPEDLQRTSLPKDVNTYVFVLF